MIRRRSLASRAGLACLLSCCHSTASSAKGLLVSEEFRDPTSTLIEATHGLDGLAPALKNFRDLFAGRFRSFRKSGAAPLKHGVSRGKLPDHHSLGSRRLFPPNGASRQASPNYILSKPTKYLTTHSLCVPRPTDTAELRSAFQGYVQGSRRGVSLREMK